MSSRHCPAKVIDGKGIAAVAVMKFNLGTSSEKRLVNDIRKRDNAAIKKDRKSVV